MAIKDPLMFITIEEFKNWKGFNKLEFDDTTTPDNEIWFAISVASNNIDYLSGYSISKKWPETTLTEFTDIVQTATAYYVRFLLTKDSNYIRGQSSISQGGMTYSETNPTDPYFIVPEVFNCLRKIKEYPNITGFNLDVLPKRNDFFTNFYSNYGEDSPLTRYLEIINLKTNDTRVKIYPKHPKHLIGTELWIDTTGIKSFDNLTTLELFTKYFSNDTMKLVDGKETQEKKVISAIGGNSLWEVDKDNPNFIKSKDDKGIIANSKRIIDVGTPTFLSDATTKVYVDNLLDKKQDKLIAGENIKIDEKTNTISATGGKVDLSDYYKKEEVDKKLEDKMDKEQFQYVFAINTIGTEIPSLETTNKTIAGAINEINKKVIISPENIYTKDEVDHLLDDLSRNITDSHMLIVHKIENTLQSEINKVNETINNSNIIQWKEVGNKKDIKTIEYNFITKRKYRIYYSFLTSTDADNFSYSIKEFLYGGNIGRQFLESWEDLSKNIIYLQVYNNTISIYSSNTRGKIFKLEEQILNNNYEIISNILAITKSDIIDNNKPLHITSSTLNIKELKENTFDIELKDIHPIPSIPQWKEVGTREKNKWDNWQITYDFQENKHYRVYYSWSIYNPVYTIQEFIITDKKIAGIQIQTFNDSANIVILSVQHAKWITIYTGKGNLKGNVWKLEELQE